MLSSVGSSTPEELMPDCALVLCYVSARVALWSPCMFLYKLIFLEERKHGFETDPKHSSKIGITQNK